MKYSYEAIVIRINLEGEETEREQIRGEFETTNPNSGYDMAKMLIHEHLGPQDTFLEDFTVQEVSE
ncbi:MAG: hypothetical protein HW405_567 [Candidatus Berkelbacteria bacterium]|nr:hypothetical protein [Candidatus Berkelbacteria bacterium]